MAARVFIGIDATAGRRPMNLAVLGHDLRVLYQGVGTAAEVLALVLEHPAATVAVDAPQFLNAGVLRDPAQRKQLGLKSPRGWEGYRVCEWELRRRGMGLYATPSAQSTAPAWMRAGFELYAALKLAGYVTYAPGNAEPRQVLEVHPHACYTVLLGRVPLLKSTLEGRLQRQLVLHRARLGGVADPLRALEELTPHALLAGQVDLPGLLDHDALDALVAAYTACLAARVPPAVTQVGHPADGEIVLPVPPGGLREGYAR
jgi:hypothetical protein